MLLYGDEWEKGQEDPAAEHGQQPTQIERNCSEANRRNNPAKELDGRIGHTEHDFEQAEEKPTRSKAARKHEHPVENEAQPEHPRVDPEYPENDEDRNGDR